MNPHLLFKLLNELMNRYEMRGLPSISSLFHSKFNKFNNKGAGVPDNIYHKALNCFNINFIAWRYITPRKQRHVIK